MRRVVDLGVRNQRPASRRVEVDLTNPAARGL
jgi:hypothetical protein